MAPLALALGMCSAACAAMAALVRADRAVEMALAPLTQLRAASSGRWTHLLERLGRNGLAARSKEFLRSRLEMAGAPWPVEAVLGSKVALSICVVVLCLALGLLEPLAALMSIPIGVAAFRFPDFAIARMARRRLARIAAQVPDMADLLLATTQSGLTAPVAFRRSAEALRGPLADELASALRQIDLGIPWRTALDEVAHHIDDPSFRRLVSALGRSQRLGTSVAAALRTVADDLRSERRTLAEERARRAPVKMLLSRVWVLTCGFVSAAKK